MPCRTCSVALAVLLLALLAAAPGRAAPVAAPSVAPPPAGSDPASTAAPVAPAAPAPVPAALIVGRAEETLASLERLAARMRDDPELERVARALPAEEQTVARIQAAVAASAGPVAAERDLDDLERQIARAEDRLATLHEVLDASARQFQVASAELDRLRGVWAATAAAPDTGHAPERIRQRVAEVNDRIAEMDGRTGVYLAGLVDLQDRVARTGTALGAIAAAARQARRTLERQLFEVESAPLWRAIVTPTPAGEGARRARATMRTHLQSLDSYLRWDDLATWIQLAFGAVLAAVLHSLHRARGTAVPDTLEAAVLRHPLLASALATLVLTPLFQPRAPAPLFEVAALAAIVPWVLVSRDVVPRRLFVPQLAVTVMFAIDRFAALAPAHAVWARVVLLAVSVAGVALLGSGLRQGGWVSALGRGGWRSTARAGLWVGLALLGFAVLTNVAGNVTLATRLTRGTLSAALGSVMAVGGVLVAHAAASATLRLETARRRRIVALHGAVIERRFGQLARWSAFALWTWFAASSFRVADRALTLATAVLTRPLSVGSLHVSLGDLAAFGVTLWLAIVLSRLVRFVLDEGVLPAMPLGRGIPGAISKTVQYVVVGMGLLAALYASGLEIGKFSLFAGTLGVGIGFGLQNVVNNFVSGLILLYERPVQPGDIIEVGTVVGEVRRIGVRSSTVRTFQGADVIVPNGTLISAEVVNWTLTDRTRRAEVAVSVAYGTDPAAVKAILLEAVQREDVLRDPEPVVLFTAFGDSALQFEVRFWPARFDTWVVVASEVREKVLRELNRAGISIPFPQRDVHFHSEDRAPVVAPARNVAVAVPGPPSPIVKEDPT